MKLTTLLAVSALLAVTSVARAERPDCSLFHGTQAQFACYENVSRAPEPAPKDSLKPDSKAKAATTRSRQRHGD